jgi:hypothetical protein
VELEERDVTQIVLRSAAENPEIVEQSKFAKVGFALVLIGKDGGEKLRPREIVDSETLCRLIDSMPMRQEEMSKMRAQAAATRQ